MKNLICLPKKELTSIKKSSSRHLTAEGGSTPPFSCLLLNSSFMPLSTLSGIRASLVAQMVKNVPAMQESEFDPWVRKVPWRREWQPILVFLLRKSLGERNLVGYSPGGCRVRHDWVTNNFKWNHSLSFCLFFWGQGRYGFSFFYQHYVCSSHLYPVIYIFSLLYNIPLQKLSIKK